MSDLIKVAKVIAHCQDENITNEPMDPEEVNPLDDMLGSPDPAATAEFDQSNFADAQARGSGPLPPRTARQTGLVRVPDVVLGGIASGIAHRYGWNIVLVRLVFLLVFLGSVLTSIELFVFALICYLIAWTVIPRAEYWPPGNSPAPTTMSEATNWASIQYRWGGILIVPSFFAMVLGIFSSPGFWWDEAFSYPYCWELYALPHEGWLVLAVLAWPLSIGAVRIGMLSQRRRAQSRAQRLVAFPWHRRAAMVVAVTGSTFVAARAVLELGFHFVEAGELSHAAQGECISQLWPAMLGQVVSPLLLVFLFVLGRRAMDYE